MAVRGHFTQADLNTQPQNLTAAAHGMWEYIFMCEKWPNYLQEGIVHTKSYYLSSEPKLAFNWPTNVFPVSKNSLISLRYSMERYCSWKAKKKKSRQFYSSMGNVCMRILQR